MKQKFNLLFIAASLCSGTASFANTPQVQHFSAEKSFTAPARSMVKAPARRTSKAKASRADEAGVYSYTTNLTGLLYLGMDEQFHVPSEPITFIPPFKEITWTNTSTGFGADKKYQWRYVDPTYGNYKPLTKILTYDEKLTLSYAAKSPYPTGIYMPQLFGEGEFWFDVDYYSPGSMIPGGSSDRTFNGDLNFGVNPSINIGKVDMNLNGASFISSPYYNYTKGSKNEAWSTELGAEFEGIVAYGNIFPRPMTPYSISRTWAYLVIEANAATSIKVNVYKVDDNGNVMRDECIAYGEAAISEGANKIIAADLTGIDEDGFDSIDPIAIDFPILVEYTGFADNTAIESVEPKLVIKEQFSANKENPYEINFRVAYKSGNDVITAEPKWNIEANDDKSILIAPANMGIMINAVFPWCIESNDTYSYTAPDAGGEFTFNIDSYYAFGEEQEIEKEAGCDWFEVTVGEAGDETTPVTVKVTALEGAGRSGKFTVKAPAVNVEFAVAQGEGAGVGNINAADGVAVTRYFDIFGRELNAAPANGIYIQKSVNADGSTTSIKKIAH